MRDDGGRGCQKLPNIAWRQLWTTPWKKNNKTKIELLFRDFLTLNYKYKAIFELVKNAAFNNYAET